MAAVCGGSELKCKLLFEGEGHGQGLEMIGGFEFKCRVQLESMEQRKCGGGSVSVRVVAGKDLQKSNTIPKVNKENKEKNKIKQN
jgi:hypothetical protein